MFRAAANTERLRLVAVGPRQTSRRPIRLRRVAAAGAVEGGDVLQRDEDVAVELEVRNAFYSAVRRERPVLILAAEELDLDLLALVFVRVVLHCAERSGRLGKQPFVDAV